MFSGGLHWTEYFKAVGPTLIGVFVAYVAWRQWQINRATLKERLFERRMEVFKGTQKFLSEILRDATYSDAAFWEFTDICQRARFLFGKSFQEVLLNIRTRAGKMRLQQKKLQGVPVGEERSRLVDIEHDELEWLNAELSKLFDIFEPFLGFENHK